MEYEIAWNIASISFGKDSLYMVLRLIEEGAPLDEVVFYDTGMEFQAIYKMRDELLPFLTSHNIKYTELTPSYGFLYKMFELPVISNAERSCEKCKHYKLLSLSWGCCNNPASKFYQTHDEDGGGLPSEKSPYGKGSCKLLELKRYTKYGYSWCGGPCRWGTGDKLNVLDKYAEERNAIMYIGVAADETPRLLKERKKYKRFPLAEWGVSEAECLKGCYQRGFEWRENGHRLYDLLDRVSCWCCANKNLKELKNIYMYLPCYWEKLKDLQRRTSRPMKGEGKSVFDLEKRFIAEIKAEKQNPEQICVFD